MQNNDHTESLQNSVLQAIETNTPLQISGGASKSFFGRTLQGKILDTKSHQGIISYHPSELVLSARAGTPLSVIEKTLEEQGQMLAFEPPYFSDTATLGGTIACGLSGARRPFTGSVRDFVLGCKIINGKAEFLSFGGEVMKNVAGYDVSRLMVGAMGTLGVIMEISLKVLPLPADEKTLIFELNLNDALDKMTALSKKSLPLSALSFDGQLMYARLSGSEKTVMAAQKNIGGEWLPSSKKFWKACNEHQMGLMKNASDLWRISVPPATPEILLAGEWFYEWAGAQRWLITNEDSIDVFKMAEKLQGHATLYRASDRTADLFQPLTGTLKKLNQNIKTAFDPKGIFNPFRMARDW